jgi:hypothetical protein
MTAPLPVLSPSSILPPPSCHCALIPAKPKLGVLFEYNIVSSSSFSSSSSSLGATTSIL